MELKIGIIIGLLVGSILLAALVPTALNTMYDTNSNTFHFGTEGMYDASGKPIAEDLNGTADTATAAIWNLLPLFGVLAALGVMAVFVYKEYA